VRAAVILFFVVITALGSLGFADEVVFKNGDRLTGKIESYDGSKLILQSAMVGKVTIEMKNVKTFSSSGPIDVVLSQGPAVHERVSAGPEGSVTLVPQAGSQRVIPIAEIKKLNPPPVRWTGNVQAGAAFARGNTDTDNVNAAAHLERKGEKDLTTVDAQYLFARQRIVGDGKHETADDLLGKAKYQYYFTPRFYTYASVEAEHDVIAGLALRLLPGVGGGYQWIDTPHFNLNTEAGAGVLYRNYANDGDSINANARLAYHAKLKANDKVMLFNNAEYLPGLNRIGNYFINADAGIHTSITDKLFFEFKFEYRYDSEPAPGKVPNDLRYIASVGWNF